MITLSNLFCLACLFSDPGKISNIFVNPLYKLPFIQTAMFHGDVNLSCTMTFLSTLGSFAFTSLWVYLLGRQVLVRSSTRVSNTLFTFVNDSLALWRLDGQPYHNVISLLRPMIGKDIPIPYMNIAMSLVSFTVPLLLGVAFKRKWPKKALVLSKKVERSIYHHITISLSILQYYNCPKKSALPEQEGSVFKKSHSSAHLGLTPTVQFQQNSYNQNS